VILKFEYSREADILVVVLAHGEIEYVEQAGPINIHFSRDKKPLAIEILEATEFLSKAVNFTKKAENHKRIKS